MAPPPGSTGVIAGAIRMKGMQAPAPLTENGHAPSLAANVTGQGAAMPADPPPPAGIGQDARIITLIGTGHFLSHFYVLSLPPLFLFWQAFIEHWMVFVGWTVLGQLIYFGYGMRHSRLNKPAAGK